MSTSDTGAKVKRRPATYGKISRRAVLGYQSPDKEMQEDDNEDACVQETLVGRIRKTSPTKNPSKQKKNGSTSSNSSIPGNDSGTSESQGLLNSKSSTQAVDLFDVPSSDDNRPKYRAKPTTKKRRIQEKSPGKNLRPQSPRVEPRHHTNPSSASNVLLPPPEIYYPKQKNLIQTTVKKSDEPRTPDAAVVRAHPGLVSNGAEMAKSDKHKNHQQHKRRAVGQEPSLESTYTENYRHISPPWGPTHSNSSRQSGAAATRTSSSSPRTPIRDLGKSPSRKFEPDKHLSPSGLDIPGLSLSNVSSSLPFIPTPQRASVTQANPATGRRRIKVKDRLTNRDGLKSRGKTDSEDSDSSGKSDFDKRNTKTPVLDFKSDDKASGISNEETVYGSRVQSSFTRSRQHFTTSGPKVTYTARQRTLRQENSEDDMLLEFAMDEGHTSKQTRRLDIHNSKFNFPAVNESEDSDSELQQVAPVRTIHELRQAGGNARVFSQAETILDDIDSNTISLKRSGILELDAKLQEPDFRAHFTSHGLITRLLMRVAPSLDVLTKTILTIPILRILAYDNSSQTLDRLSDPSIVLLFQELLAKLNPLEAIAKDRSSNASKAIQQEIAQLCEKLSKSSIWRLGFPQKITPRIISLQCLDYLVRHLRETGVTENLLNKALLEDLLGSLRSTGPSVGDANFQESGTEIKLILSVLESSTLLSKVSIPVMENMWSDGPIANVASFLVFVGELVPNNNSQIWCLTLRLSLNLISRSTKFCEMFAKSSVVESVIASTFSNFNKIATELSQEDQTILSDSLVLSLGFLLVLAEAGSDYRSLFVVKNSQNRTPLDILLDLFNSRWQKAFEVVSEDELRRNIPLGFLAALLSYLSIEPSIRKLIASRLEGGNLRHLLIAVSEFLVIYQKTEEIRSTDEDVDLTASFVDKLRVVVETLREQEKIKAYSE